MRKLLLFSLAMAAGTAFAQNKVVYNRTANEAPLSHTVGEAPMSLPTPQARVNSGQNIWSEDFANGIPANWTNQSLDTAGKPNALWEYRGANTTPNINTGSRGAFAGTQGPVQSPTRANGFVIFDSDWRDNNGNAQTMGQGTAATPHASRLITPNINMANVPFGRVSFNTFARKFAATFAFCISRDGGTTWPDTINIYSALAVNAASPNNQVRNIDFQAGTATVKLQWLFDARNALAGANGLGYYFWMIDDIVVSARPSNDISLDLAEVIQGPLDTVIAGNPFYAVVPKISNSQNQHIPTTFVATIANRGSNNQPNAKVNVNVKKLGSSVYTNTSTPSIFNAPTGVAAATRQVFMQNNPWTLPASADTGVYQIEFTASSDSTDASPADNVSAINYVRSTDIFSAAYFPPYNNLITRSASFATNGTGSFTNAADGCIGCTMMSLANAVRITDIGVRLATATRPGGDIVVTIRDTTGILTVDTSGGIPILTNPQAFPVILTADNYTLTAADSLSRTLRISIPDITLLGTNQTSAKLLAGNKAYWICAEMFSNAGAARLGLLDDQTVTQPFHTSIIFLPADGANRAARWFTNGNSYGLAAHFTTGTASKELSLIRSMYPNPTSGEVNLTFESNTAADVNVVIRDIAGREVYRQAEGKRMAGAQTLTISTDNLRNGIYTVELNVGTHRSVEKLSVNR